MTTSRITPIFNMTKIAFATADSLIPTTSSAVMAMTIATAGKLMMEPENTK